MISKNNKVLINMNNFKITKIKHKFNKKKEALVFKFKIKKILKYKIIFKLNL